jgi:hypothetical protein
MRLKPHLVYGSPRPLVEKMPVSVGVSLDLLPEPSY